MATTPWRQEVPASLVGARKWGTGINPIHSQPYGNIDVGRNLAPGVYNGRLLESTQLVAYDFGYSDEDDVIGEHNGDFAYLEPHPGLGDIRQRGYMDYPSWGQGGDPIPQGTALRSHKTGMAWKEQIPLQQPRNSATEGWTNKEHGAVLDSRVSDESQIYIQTSMVQRDKVQDNHLAQMRSTDDPRSEIPSRITGVKVKNYSGGIRHADMTPKTQDGPHRAWLTRTAGTGPTAWIEPNAMVSTTPIQRSIPDDAYQGPLEYDVAITAQQTEMYDEWSNDGW